MSFLRSGPKADGDMTRAASPGKMTAKHRKTRKSKMAYTGKHRKPSRRQRG